MVLKVTVSKYIWYFWQNLTQFIHMWCPQSYFQLTIDTINIFGLICCLHLTTALAIVCLYFSLHKNLQILDLFGNPEQLFLFYLKELKKLEKEKCAQISSQRPMYLENRTFRLSVGSTHFASCPYIFNNIYILWQKGI